MRRIAVGCLTFLTLSGTFLVLPVYAAPTPEPVPVEVISEEVALGSVENPAPAADVQAGTTAPVSGVSDSSPVLTVRETDVAEFSLAGVSWAHDPAVTDTLVQIRVRDEDGSWGLWTEAEAEGSGQDAGTPAGQDVGPAPGVERRGGTEPVWTGPSTGVEVELVTRSGAQPTDVRLDLIDPGKSAADARLETAGIQDTANAATAVPPIYSREQWGANPEYMTWDPQYPSTIKAAVIHHTAGSNSYTADDVPKILRGIYHYHAVTRGWGDIGYNALVDKYGRTWEGRAGGLASTVVGAHSGGFNSYTFGVSMIGNYDTARPSQTMVDAVSAVVGWKLSLYGVDPMGSTTLTSGGTNLHPAGTQVRLPTVFAHRDTKSTSCPGQYGYAKMGEIRATAAKLTTAASLVNSLYADVLRRAPAERDLDSWTTAVADSGDRWVAVRGFSGSEEYRRLFVTEAYHEILGRAPEAAGVDFWNAEIAARRTTLDRLRSQLMLSREFYLRGGGTDGGFVELMYQRSFGRSAAQQERDLWSATIASKGRAEAVRGIWDSYESALHRVDRSYGRWLARAASPAEQDYWSGMVVSKGDESMREAAMASPEYLQRARVRFP